jgi:Phytanoyl-CoA dioxygenase (PhyH)
VADREPPLGALRRADRERPGGVPYGNVSACHRGIAGIVRGPLLAAARAALGAALGVDVVDFKDKINYKQPGGAGFAAHQDMPAYPGVTQVVSVVVAIDECTTASGCGVAAEDVCDLLPTDDRGVVTDEASSGLS